MRTFLVCAGIWFASTVVTTASWVGYAVVHDAMTRPAHTRVAFSDLLAAIDMGLVEEIRIEGPLYVFRIRTPDGGRVATEEAIGPEANEAQINVLRPRDPQLPPPKVVFASP
jgi:hypothetical protein